MSDTPKVSVIIPVYNVEDYLRPCLDSITGQTLRDIEILCVNDGSTDGSLAILQEYAARDSRMRVQSQANTGQGTARNRAIEQAKGEYVYFMDSDDILEREALEKLWQQCCDEDLDALFFSGQTFYENKELEEANPWFATAYRRKGSYEQVCTGPELFVQMREQKDYYASPCLSLSRRALLMEQEVRFALDVHQDELYTFHLSMAARRAFCIGDVYFRRRLRKNSTITGTAPRRDMMAYFGLFWSMDALVKRYAPVLTEQEMRAFQDYQHTILSSARRACMKLEELPEDQERLFPRLVTDWCADRRMVEQSKEILAGRDERIQALTEWKDLACAQRDQWKEKYLTMDVRRVELTERTRQLTETVRQCWDKSRELNDNLHNARSKLRETKDKLRTVRKQSRKNAARIEDLEARLERQKSRADKYKDKAETNAARLKQVKASAAYKVGRVLTWPFRTLKRLFGGKQR